jgi:Fe-S-cluster-containing dehydrogenase component
MHCQNPPCADLCPWGAAKQEENGVVRIDDQLCLGGSKCKKVCPWHIPQRQSGVGLYLDVLPQFAGNGVMYKCDRCFDRLKEGKLPACIEVCPEQAQIIGPRDEIVAEAHRRAKEMNGYIYGEKENGGTNTIYVSPVPFGELNKAVEKGPGRPHLKPVANSMANEDNLTKALFIAPIAAVAAGVGKFWNFLNKDDKEDS